MRLQVDLEAGAVRPGDAVAGCVHVLEGGPCRSLALNVGFYERSPSFAAAPFVDGGVLYEGELASGQAIDFRYELPRTALPSVKGVHGELFWELEVVAQEPGLDTRVRRGFEVAGSPARR